MAKGKITLNGPVFFSSTEKKAFLPKAERKKSLTIDASKLEKGNYILVFKNDKISKVKKIIKR